MNNEKVFLLCKHCGNLAGMVHYKGVPMICCGEPMAKLVANTSDGATEKHVPVVERNEAEVTIKIGSVNHPMLEEHFINWIYLETKKGSQCKKLKAGDEPMAKFMLEEGDIPVAAYEYCNLHGLWKLAEIK